jgi:hypothetical protein
MLPGKISYNYDQLLGELEKYLLNIRKRPFAQEQTQIREMLEKGAIEFFYQLAKQDDDKAAGDVIDLLERLPNPRQS